MTIGAFWAFPIASRFLHSVVTGTPDTLLSFSFALPKAMAVGLAPKTLGHLWLIIVNNAKNLAVHLEFKVFLQH